MKILFASPYCLLDTTSGAAINTRSLLEGPFDHAATSEAVTAAIFDPPREVSLESFLTWGLAALGLEPGVVEVADRRLKHTILRTASSRRSAITRQEEESLLSLIEGKIQSFRPDILLTYGGYALERRIHRLAREHDIPICFLLLNLAYSKAETFSDAAAVVVPSEFAARWYQERLGIRSHVLYPIIARERCVVGEGSKPSPIERRFITFINSGLPKGLTVFWRIAAEAVARLPAAEFLVVEGRWTREDSVRIGLDLGKLPNVSFLPNQADMRPVYARTRILLFPSLGVGNFGQTVAEAQLNGIPVIATRREGTIEALNGGGFVLDIPEGCASDPKEVPTAEEISPWLEHIRVLLEEPAAYEEARTRALQAAQRFAPEITLESAARLFREVAGKDLTPGLW